MICEIIRGLAFISRVADRAQEMADRAGFACDEAPCFRDSGDKEGRGCDMTARFRDDDDEDKKQI